MTSSETVKSESITILPEQVVHLPLGLLGFEHVKRYVLLEEPGQEPFLWLQMLDDRQLAFLVMPPFEAVPDYRPEISTEDVEFIGLKNPDDALIYNIVTLRPNGRATMNLKGPVVLNRLTRRGKQVVLVNAADYQLQHPLPVAE